MRYEDLGRFTTPLTILALYLIIVMMMRPRGVILVLWLAGMAVLVASVAIGILGLWRIHP